MYRILIFSDTHGYTKSCVSMLHKIPQVDLVLHAGDIASDCRFLETACQNFECVAGNNDWNCSYPKEKVLSVADKTLFLTHGHLYGVKNSYSKLTSHAKSIGADIVVFGHTHMPHCGYSEGILLLNPGSSAGVYGPQATCGMIEIENGKISADILTMGDFL